MKLNRLPAALHYAADAHADQVRKGTDLPYVSHPMAVSALILEHGGNEDQAIAGLLHDVLEDCGGAHEASIRAQFGDRVCDMVLSCTDGLPDAAGMKPPWKERKVAYLEHLAQAPDDAILVTLADKVHNARAIASDLAAGHAVFERFSASRDATLWYYGALLQVLSQRRPGHALVTELRASLNRIDGLLGATA